MLSLSWDFVEQVRDILHDANETAVRDHSIATVVTDYHTQECITQFHQDKASAIEYLKPYLSKPRVQVALLGEPIEPSPANHTSQVKGSC